MASGSEDYYTPDAQLATAITHLSSSLTKLDTVVTRLDTSITKLIDIVTATQGRRLADYAKITTSCKQIVDIRSAGYYNVSFYSHHDNTANITVFLLSNCDGTAIKTLSPGDLFTVAGCNTDLSAKSSSGTQYLKVIVAGRASS